MSVSRRLAALVLSAVALFLVSPAAFAQNDLFWNPPTGGTGAWDTTTVNWGPTNATATTAWPNTGNDRANFGNTTTTAATVTVAAGGVNAYGINFLNYESVFLFVSGNATG